MTRGIPFLLAAAGAALLPSLAPDWIGPASVVLIYVLAGSAASLELGWAGLPDFAVASWFSAGACCTALLMRQFALPLWACIPVCAVAAAVIAPAIATHLLRLRREVFAIATLGVALIVPTVLAQQNLLVVRPIAVPAGDAAQAYDILIAMLLLAGAAAIAIGKSPLGLALRASAEDEIACRNIGLNTRYCKLVVVAISACTAAVAGSLLLVLQGSFNPADAGPGAIATIFAIAIVAGRRVSGAVLPALIIAGIPQLFPAMAEYRVILAGAAMLCCAVWRVTAPAIGGNRSESLDFAQAMKAWTE